MLRLLTRRRAALTAAAALSALVLTGCGGSGSKDDPSSAASSPSSSASDDAAASTGPAADPYDPSDPTKVKPCAVPTGGKSAGVTVSGAFGQKDPKVTFTSPLSSSKFERTILTPGSKVTTKKGDVANVFITAINGRTGAQISSEPAKVVIGDTTYPSALDAGFDCVGVGARVVSTFPAKDLYGSQGNVELKVEKDDSIVLVTDIASLVKPTKPAKWSNAPKVTLKKGQPSFKLVGKPAPTLMYSIIKKGTGAVVGGGDTVTVKYYGVSWNTKKVFDQNFSAGKPPASFPVAGVVPGFSAALVGEKVGTTLIVTMPPKDGYGVGAINSTDLKGQTLVFYVQILSTKAS